MEGFFLKMSRIRYIKPDFYSDTKLSGASVLARYLYIGLFCDFDMDGVTLDDAKLIKRSIFPYDDDIPCKRVDTLLGELILLKRLYRFVHDGEKYLFCPTFKKHQKFHIHEKSKYSIPLEVLEKARYQQGASTVLAPVQHQNAVTRSTATVLASVSGSDFPTLLPSNENGYNPRCARVGSDEPDPEGVLFELKIPKKKKPKQETELGHKTSELIAAYVTAFEKKFSCRPDLTGRTIGQIKNFMRSVPLARAVNLIEVFFQIDDKWFKTKGYDWQCFENNLAKVGIALDTGQISGQTDWNQIFKEIQEEQQQKQQQIGLSL